MLTDPDLRLNIVRKCNTVYNDTMKNWVNCQRLDKIGDWCTKSGMISVVQVTDKLGYPPILIYQYKQVRSFLMELLQTNDVFHILTSCS